MKGIYTIENPTKEALKPAGGPPPGGPAGGPPAGGPPPMGGPMAATLTLKWDGNSALWTNEMGQKIALEDLKETDGTLTFTAMAGPAPIEWTIHKDGNNFTAISHRGADIHGNSPVDTICKVSYQPL